MPMYQQDQEGVAPPGWETTIKKWKRQGDGKKPVKNPWALAWYLKNRGVKPLTSEAEDLSFVDASVAAEYTVFEGLGRVPRVYDAAARGEGWAQAALLSGGSILYQEY